MKAGSLFWKIAFFSPGQKIKREYANPLYEIQYMNCKHRLLHTPVKSGSLFFYFNNCKGKIGSCQSILQTNGNAFLHQ
jgi:hypothetical protein